MNTTPKGRCVALSLVLALGSVAPCLAKVSGEDFEIEGGIVRSHVDDFTDAYSSTVLAFWGPGGSITVTHWPGRFEIRFIDSDREYQVPDDKTSVEVVFRVDDLEAITLTATWWDQHELAWVEVSESWLLEMADMFRSAETILYRIGPRGDVLRFSVPPELPELIAEFRRRVAEAIAAGDE